MLSWTKGPTFIHFRLSWAIFFSREVRLSVPVAASSRRFAAEDNWDKFKGLQGRKEEVKMSRVNCFPDDTDAIEAPRG